MKSCVWTHLGLTKWKTTSKKIKMEDDLRKEKKWKTTSKKTCNGMGQNKTVQLKIRRNVRKTEKQL